MQQKPFDGLGQLNRIMEGGDCQKCIWQSPLIMFFLASGCVSRNLLS